MGLTGDRYLGRYTLVVTVSSRWIDISYLIEIVTLYLGEWESVVEGIES